jgi:hypothetical protein
MQIGKSTDYTPEITRQLTDNICCRVQAMSEFREQTFSMKCSVFEFTQNAIWHSNESTDDN